MSKTGAEKFYYICKNRVNYFQDVTEILLQGLNNAMEKLNYEQHLFFSLFSVLFFGKRLRTVQRPKGGVPEAPKNTKKKAFKKTALRYMSFKIQQPNLSSLGILSFPLNISTLSQICHIG